MNSLMFFVRGRSNTRKFGTPFSRVG